MKEIFNSKLKALKKIDKRYFIIFIVTVIIFLPYISKNFIRGHDFKFHIPNLYAIDSDVSLKDFSIFPSKVRNTMANEFGYGSGIFYPQFSYYTTILIFKVVKLFGGSIIVAVKIFEFLLVFLSGIFIFKFVNKVFDNRDSALISSIVYMSSPYLLTDVFARFSYAEMAIFLFIPIIMLAIYYLFHDEHKKFSIYFIIGYVGMINSHLVLTVYFSIFLLILFLLNIKKIWKKEKILYLIGSSIIVLLITSPFWVPLLEHKLKGEYVVFQDNAMVTYTGINSWRADFSRFISKGFNDRIEIYISSVVIVLCLYCVLNIKKYRRNKIQFSFVISMIIFAMISIICASKLMNWGAFTGPFKILLNIQFPWRLCTILTFSSSILAGAAIKLFSKQNYQLILIIVCVVCLSDVNYIFKNLQVRRAGVMTYEEMTSVDSKALGTSKEYLPVKAKENYNYLSSRNHDILVVSGDADISIEKDNTPTLEFSINMPSKTIVEIPRLFYYGYNIQLKASSGNTKNLSYYENENGFIEFEVPESGEVLIKYSGSLLNKVASFVSVLTILLLVVFQFISFHKRKVA